MRSQHIEVSEPWGLAADGREEMGPGAAVHHEKTGLEGPFLLASWRGRHTNLIATPSVAGDSAFSYPHTRPQALGMS
jgi:hypothetical protein